MVFTQDIRSVIAARVSVRRYRPEPLLHPILEEVIAAGDQSVPLDGRIGLRFVLAIDGPAFADQAGALMGSYGRILHAPHYIIAVSEIHPNYMVNAGFRMEQMILYATALGLGTCWMGGFYSRKRVAHMLNIRSDEQVVALTPIGYPAEGWRSHIIHRSMKWFTPAHGRRRPLEEIVFWGQWGTPAGNSLAKHPGWHELLEAARLAPSWRNTQPWRFIVREEELIVTVSRPAEQIGLPYYLLDGGIAMSHIFLVARQAGWNVAWEINPERLAPLRQELGIPQKWDIIGLMKMPSTSEGLAPCQGR